MTPERDDVQDLRERVYRALDRGLGLVGRAVAPERADG
jgi:hypothetical protein